MRNSSFWWVLLMHLLLLVFLIGLVIEAKEVYKPVYQEPLSITDTMRSFTQWSYDNEEQKRELEKEGIKWLH